NKDASPHFSHWIILAARDQRIPIFVLNGQFGDLTNAPYSVSAKRYDDMIPRLDLFSDQAACPSPAVPAFGFASQLEAPVSLPPYGGALILEPALPHARVPIFRAVDFPQSLHLRRIFCRPALSLASLFILTPR